VRSDPSAQVALSHSYAGPECRPDDDGSVSVLAARLLTMKLDDNKALIRGWLRMGEHGFVDDFNEYFTADYTGHLSSEDPQTLNDLVKLERGFAQSFSNISYNVEDLLAVDDRVVLRVTTRASHTGAFHGIEPTGRPVTFTGIVIYRIVGAKIAESWGELDLWGLFRQLRSV
jgi:predicted ester cyclase